MFIKRNIRAGKAYTLSNASQCWDIGNLHIFKKRSHRDKAPSNKTPALTKSTSMDKLP